VPAPCPARLGIYSTVSASDPTPANLGDITIDESVTSGDFELSIKNGSNPGAANVRSIVLKNNNTRWNCFSTLSDAKITKLGEEGAGSALVALQTIERT